MANMYKVVQRLYVQRINKGDVKVKVLLLCGYSAVK